MRIIDDKIKNIRNDIEKIQAKPTMYISFIGERAFEHIIHELLDNVKDENLNKHSISDGTCKMLYDQPQNMYYIEDTGRGVPFEELENICTILHSGSKMERAYGNSSGENGVGLTVANALSEVFEITSMRNGQMRMLQFKNGKKTMDVTQAIPKGKHGLMVAFSPNRMLLGKDCVMPIESVKSWLLKTSFFMPKKMNVQLTIEYSGKEATSVHQYQNTDGIGGFLPRIVPEANLLKTPVVLENSCMIKEEVPVKKNGKITTVTKDRVIELQFSFNYNAENPGETIRYSFCNTLENIEHGEHANAISNVLIAFFKKALKESSSKKNLDIVSQDILTGLAFVVNINTDLSVGLFTSQTKHKLDNKIIYDPVWKLGMESLDRYFKLPENKKTLNAILGCIRSNISARLAAAQSRRRTKKSQSFMDTTLIANYRAPNDIDVPGTKCELYIVEGDSAGSNAATGRYNNDIQGALGLQGKPSNVYGLSLETLNKKKDAYPDFKKLMDDILGCGYGPNFNINNLRYDKIIISTDADVDGGHIAGEIVAIIYYWAPRIILEGHLYRVLTPFYRLSSADKTENINNADYIYSKDEYFSRYADIVSGKFAIEIHGKLTTKADMAKFLKDNKDYYVTLNSIANHYSIHPDIVEYIAVHPDWSNINKEFPELLYDEKERTITGGYNGDYYSIVPYTVFLEQLGELRSIIETKDAGEYKFEFFTKVRGKGSTSQGIKTVGQIMSGCSVYEPKIHSRYKGLGEFDPIEFYHLIMDPHKRKLIRLTIQDAEEMVKNMNELFLDSPQMRAVRKNLVATANISVDDIDN